MSWPKATQFQSRKPLFEIASGYKISVILFFLHILLLVIQVTCIHCKTFCKQSEGVKKKVKIIPTSRMGSISFCRRSFLVFLQGSKCVSLSACHENRRDLMVIRNFILLFSCRCLF